MYKNIYPIKWQDNQSGVLLTPSWDLLYTNGCLWLKRELFFQLECSLNHFGSCSKNSKCVFTKYLRHFEKVLRTIPQSKTSRQFAWPRKSVYKPAGELHRHQFHINNHQKYNWQGASGYPTKWNSSKSLFILSNCQTPKARKCRYSLLLWVFPTTTWDTIPGVTRCTSSWHQ